MDSLLSQEGQRQLQVISGMERGLQGPDLLANLDHVKGKIIG